LTTAEELQVITDRGKFEILANAILCRDNPDYAALIDLGINEQGETIRASTDGFCKVPNSNPPRFVWFQHTTTDRARLRTKWLSENEESLGDLIKASKKASGLRAIAPNGKFTVVLSTNQRFDEDLAEAVIAKGEELGLEIDPWHVFRYARFLDTVPVGHFLRKEYLGIEAEMLSKDLLAELGDRSLENYANVEFQFTSPNLWIARNLEADIAHSAESLDCHLLLLVGESGFGKSAAAYRFLNKHLATGGYGLHIPERIAHESSSLEHMLRQTLNGLYPSLDSKEAARIPEIIPTNKRFVILIDDVNRTSDPPILIRKLSGWSQPPYLILCPVHARFRAQTAGFVSEPDSTESDPVSRTDPDTPQETPKRNLNKMVIVDRMHPEEASGAIQVVANELGTVLSPIQAEKIASRLGYDPFLIGALGQLLQSDEFDRSISTLVDDVLARSIDGRISEVVAISPGQYFFHEFRQALNAITTRMLEQRDLLPSWSEVSSWLQDEPLYLAVLRELRHHGRLCQISTGDDFRFLHDRFLQYFCIESLKSLLDEAEKNISVLSDPAYAEWIAQALLRAPQSKDLLDTIRESNPLALVSTIRYMGTPITDYHHLIVKKVQEWVRYRAGRYSAGSPQSLRWAVANNLLFADSPAVLEIVNTDFGLQYRRWFGGFIRFRNGDPNGAMRYCSSFGIRPGWDDYLFKQLVEHAVLHHRDALIQGLTQTLITAHKKPDLDGAPILAGFLGLPELQDAIEEWWNRLDVKSKYLVEALWAALRCSTNPYKDEFLDSIITYWAELPDTEEEKRIEKRESVGEQLRTALPPYVNNDLLGYLINQTRKYEVLRVPVASICCYVDLPDSIEFALRTSTEVPDCERLCGTWNWPTVSGTTLSNSSVERLYGLWCDQDNPSSLRSVAFALWRRNVDSKQTDVIGTIRALKPNDDLFKDTIWARACLGDTSCTPHFASILESDTNFFRVAHYIWSDQILPIAGRHLYSFRDSIPTDYSGGTRDPHWNLADLLMRIPVDDAEMLLVKHWEHLRYSRLFVQSALYIGTTNCLKLADAAIVEYPEEAPLFKEVSYRFGFSSLGRNDHISFSELKHLGRYWDRFDETTLRSFVEACYEIGDEGVAWCREHIPASINEDYRLRYCPTDNDLMEMLDQHTESGRNSIDFWIDDLKKHIDLDRLRASLRQWLESEPTSGKVKIALMCIEQIGQRSDLDMLDNALARIEHRQWLEAQVESVKFSVKRRTLK
jgi:hypothetical protein